MDAEERRKRILEFRKKDIEGECVVLRPLSGDDSAKIARLRNKPRNRYFFNQETELTEADQRQWFEGYRGRDNDIYWGIYKKSTMELIGSIRLYGIDMDGASCEEGSYMVDEDYADEAPYAVEAKMLALDVAFDGLGIRIMINDNRADNKVMNNLDNQLGFDKGSRRQIRGVDYLHRVLEAEDYQKNRIRFSGLVDYWSER